MKNKRSMFRVEGSWYGNDTLWRTIADLNQILLYADKKGKIKSTPQRKRLYFCDGIIIGESEGPLEPNPKKTGFIISATDPLLTDLTIAGIFNFDYNKIPQISKSFKIEDYPISNYKPKDIIIKSNKEIWNGKKVNEIKSTFKVIPPNGWKNYIEKEYNIN